MRDSSKIDGLGRRSQVQIPKFKKAAVKQFSILSPLVFQWRT